MLSFSVKAAGVLCVLGISFGIGSYVLYKIYDRYIKPVFSRQSSVSSDGEETDEDSEDENVVCCFCLISLFTGVWVAQWERASVVQWLRVLTHKHWISYCCGSRLARGTCDRVDSRVRDCGIYA